MPTSARIYGRLRDWGVEKVLASTYLRRRLWRAWGGLLSNRDPLVRSDVRLQPLPEKYLDGLPAPRTETPRQAGSTPIFITARFRSGSTFLWQIFRSMPGYTAFYEPLNERRWFLPQSAATGTDPTHLGVNDYWAEYDGLAWLDRLFTSDWAFKSLYMDSRDSDSRLYAFIRALIDHAAGVPVLQFNRVDFRLPWLRAHFPNAKILHLYRHPREQWMSVQTRAAPVPLDYHCSEDSDLNLFYTLEWARDLRSVFPFLDPTDAGHPYAIHYMLWRLSYCFGATLAHVSVSYEDLVTDLPGTMRSISEGLNLDITDSGRLASINRGEIKERWRRYANPQWYEDIEWDCDRKLAAFFSCS